MPELLSTLGARQHCRGPIAAVCLKHPRQIGAASEDYIIVGSYDLHESFREVISASGQVTNFDVHAALAGCLLDLEVQRDN